MCSFKLIYFIIIILNLYKTNAQISDKRLCFDPDCKEPISRAKTLLRYSSPDAKILSFAPNVDITIYSKEAGSHTNLWGAEINGKRGYVPKHLVREYRILKVPKLLVDTEPIQKPQVPIDVNKGDVNPNKVQEAFEVVDGTTIYPNPQDEINPSSTESPILSTTTPEGNKEVKEDNTVDNSKEKDAIENDNKKESVVDNVISTFSNWIANDANPGEHEDAEDDDEDEEDEEDYDEEESVEDGEDSSEIIQDQENKTNIEKAEDINILNSLHNLPPGVEISPYNLELNQPVIKNTEKGAENITLQQKSPDGSSSTPALQKSNEQQISPILNNDVNSNSDSTSEVKHQTTDIRPPSNQNLIQPEQKVEIKTEIDEKSTAGTVKIEMVTEPSIEDGEALPILDEVTPNPVNIKIEAKQKIPYTTIEEKPLVTVDPPRQGLIVDTTKNPATDSIQVQSPQSKTVLPTNVNEEKLNSNPQIPVELAQQPANNIVKDTLSDSDHSQSPVEKEEDKIPSRIPPPPPLGGIFNTAPNLVVNEHGKNEEIPGVNLQKEEIVSSQVLKENISDEKIISDVPKTETTSQGNDMLTQDATTKERIENIASKEDSAGEEQISREGVGSDLKDESVSGIVEDVSKEVNLDEAPKADIENSATYISEGNQQIIEEKPPLTLDSNQPEKEEISNSDFVIDDIDNLKEDIKEEDLSSEGQSGNEKDTGGFLSGLFSFFGSDVTDNSVSNTETPFSSGEVISKDVEETLDDKGWSSQQNQESTNSDSSHCYTEDCRINEQDVFKEKGFLDDLGLNFNSDILVYLITTATSVIIFLFGYMALDRNRREAPLVAKINKLEKQLLITLKENELLQENGSTVYSAPKEIVEELTPRLTELQLAKQALESRLAELEKELEEKEGLEEQIENLEKELETSTEVGMELNRIISEMLDPTNGSDKLKENVEQLQRQLLEQKDTINTINESLREKTAENQMLHVELERSRNSITELQKKQDEVVEKIMKIEKEKDQQQNTLQNEITIYQQKFSEAVSREDVLNNDIQDLRTQLLDVQRQAEIKTREYQTLKESLDKIKSIKNDSNALTSLLDSTSMKAELQQLKAENDKFIQQLQQEQSLKLSYEKKYQGIVEEMNVIRQKYEQADKEKVEVNSKLEVLNNYFKKRETELQEEVIKYKSIWDTKEGEAASTTERIKYMQEEIENYKAQNETLKQEIMSQEIELKSQISMLEKKVHENWVTARQADRKLEDARQEAAQLRNRLTLRERAIHEERVHNRLQSPLEQNGELPLSPHPIDSVSPPLLYGRDHITKSPPLPGMPPFLPPPPGAPFMPPIHGIPPFMPPPLSMYPADHRPPPLGRMSSPPLNSRYSPDNSAFSPYDRNSPSPPYDSEYGASPPPIRGYSPYNSRDDRRDYKRPPHARTNGRNTKGPRMSSGSDHSNDSLDKISRKQSKMV